MSTVPWSDVVPSFTVGTLGNNLGYYYKIAYCLIVIPLGLLLLIAVGWNVLVGFATKWMYSNAWKKKQKGGGSTDSDDPSLPITNAWEEIYVVNNKLAAYLLGSTVAIKEQQGYLVLQIHDYNVYMPLAMIFIQVSELAVAMMMVVLFVDYLILQVSYSCDASHTNADCFLSNETDMSALPLDCGSQDFAQINVTCFTLSFNPIIAAAVTGGFLKITPHILFSALTFQYFKYMNKIKSKLRYNSTKGNIVIHAVVAFFLELGFLGFGLMCLLVVLLVPSVRDVTISQANPMRQLTVVFCFIMYFSMSGFLWCIYPQSSTPVRFLNSVWKAKVSPSHKSINEGERLRPWIVVDHSLSTREDAHLLKD